MKRLYRSETERKIAGICGGIGEMTNVDPTVIRLLFVAAWLATGVVPLTIGYLLAWWIIPKATDVNSPTTV
jgi:phage shock protein C